MDYEKALINKSQNGQIIESDARAIGVRANQDLKEGIDKLKELIKGFVMHTIDYEKALKRNMVDGQIMESEALEFGKQANVDLKTAIDLLKACKKNFGMHIGGEISELVSRLEGKKFNETAYNYERIPDGQ